MSYKPVVGDTPFVGEGLNYRYCCSYSTTSPGESLLILPMEAAGGRDRNEGNKYQVYQLALDGTVRLVGNTLIHEIREMAQSVHLN